MHGVAANLAGDFSYKGFPTAKLLQHRASPRVLHLQPLRRIIMVIVVVLARSG